MNATATYTQVSVGEETTTNFPPLFSSRIRLNSTRTYTRWLIDEEVTTGVPLNDSAVAEECNSDNVHYFLHSSFAVSVVIIFIMSFMNRRHSLNTKCCRGRPGLAVPINLLDDFDNRWSYACSFGAITNTIVVIFLGPEYFGFEAPQVAKVFVGMVTALEVCIIYFPLFACINTHHVTSGSMIGFIYSSVWLYASIKQLINCTMDPIPELLPYAGLVLSVPNIICLTGVAVRFFYNFIRACVDKAPIRQELKQNVAEIWQINYVQRQINWKKQPEAVSRWQKLLQFFRKYVYERQPQFKFSSRIICTLFVTGCCVYQLGLLYMVSNAYFSQWATYQVNRYVNVSGLPLNDTTVQNLFTAVTMLNISWIVATGISLALFAVNMIFIIFKYRKDTLKLFHGNKDFIMPSVQKQDNSLFLRNCMLFAGFQIAYMLWGYFVLNFVLWLLALLFCLLIVLPLMNGITDIAKFFVNFCIVPLVVSVSLRALQTLLSGRFFLQDKIEKEDKYKPLALNNRRVFHLTNYFFFIANIETGLFSCLYRIIQGLIFGLIFLGRLDRCVLMGGLETQDIGYNAYLGMLYTEHTHNNPVLRVFCHLLLESVKEKKLTEVEAKKQNSRDAAKKTKVKEYENLVMEGDLIDLDTKEAEMTGVKDPIAEVGEKVELSSEVKKQAVGFGTEEKNEYLELEEGIHSVDDEFGRSQAMVETDVNEANHKEQCCKETSEQIAAADGGDDDGGDDDGGDDDDENDGYTVSSEKVEGQIEKIGFVDKHCLARYRWKILLTLVNNPHLVAFRKLKPEKKEKKKKKKFIKKTEADTLVHAHVKYEQYRKLKEEIRELEVQIFGPFIERERISIACQATEDVEIESFLPDTNFSFIDKTSSEDSSINDHRPNIINSETENADSDISCNVTFPKSKSYPNNRLKALSWSAGGRADKICCDSVPENSQLRHSSLSLAINVDMVCEENSLISHNF